MYHPEYVVFPVNTGAVLSSLMLFDVCDVILQFNNLSHTFTLAFVHVVAVHSTLIVHVTGVHDVIPAHASE